MNLPSPTIIRLTWATVSLMCLTLFLSCGKQPADRSTDFSKTNMVVVVLGDPQQEYGNGLEHAYFLDDGRTTVSNIDGQPCRYLDSEGTNFGYFYFRIDPTFKKRSLKHIKLEAEYLDVTSGILGVQFDASESEKSADSAYSSMGHDIQLSGAQEWKTAVFEIRDGTFRNSQNGGCDFRLCVKPPQLCIRRVTLTRLNR